MCAKRKSRIKKWIALASVIIVAALAAAALLTRTTGLPYEQVEAKTGDITTYYSFSGNVETKHRQSVTSERVIQISAIEVKEGEKVKAGEVLLRTSAGEKIKAKISGEVVNLDVEEDSQVMAGMKLMEIVDYDNLQIRVKVDEYDLSAIEKGKEATVKIGALEKEFKGKIGSMSREGQTVNGVTFFTATIELDKDKNIRIGMSAEVRLISKQAKNVVTLPMAALQFEENNKPYVLKRNDNKMIKTAITTGINDGTKVEIISGVAGGETIYYSKPVPTEEMGFPGRGRYNSSKGGGEANGGSSENGKYQ